jgi:hypothetical protein
MQCACAILSHGAAPLYIFPHYLIKGMIFGRGGGIDHKMRVLILSIDFV